MRWGSLCSSLLLLSLKAAGAGWIRSSPVAACVAERVVVALHALSAGSSASVLLGGVARERLRIFPRRGIKHVCPARCGSCYFAGSKHKPSALAQLVSSCPVWRRLDPCDAAGPGADPADWDPALPDASFEFDPSAPGFGRPPSTDILWICSRGKAGHANREFLQTCC